MPHTVDGNQGYILEANSMDLPLYQPLLASVWVNEGIYYAQRVR